MTFRPPREFYRKLFRLLLQNQEERGAVRTVCYVCAPLYEAYSLNLAIEKKIPLVFHLRGGTIIEARLLYCTRYEYVIQPGEEKAAVMVLKHAVDFVERKV